MPIGGKFTDNLNGFDSTKFTEVGKYQIYDRLRKSLEGSLLGKGAKRFIENDGSKRYRILTHPDFVTYERGNLLKHAEPEVREIAKKLPKNSKEKRL